MKEKLTVLVTNDDGPESPTLLPLLDELSKLPWVANLQVAIPPEEHSWISQAVSRDRAVTVQESRVGEHPVYLIDGTPADCVLVAAFNLNSVTPDLLISGVNIGTNGTTAFTYNSGTVGAARQGASAGITSIAYSAHVPFELFLAWDKRDQAALEQQSAAWRSIAASCSSITKELYDICQNNSLDYLSVNLPHTADPHSDLQFSSLERWMVNRVFKETEPNTFRMEARLEMIKRCPSEDGPEAPLGDFSLQQAGKITVTPFRLHRSGVAEDELAELQQQFEQNPRNKKQ